MVSAETVSSADEFGDVHLSLPPRQGDDLVLPFIRIHIRTSGRPTPGVRFDRACRGPFVTPGKRVAPITG